MKDFGLYERGNGGDIIVKNNDIESVSLLSNQVYIALFGGNVEGISRNDSTDQEKNDYWANNLIFKNLPNKQFNSITEKTLNEIVLNSSGRVTLIEAIKADLSYLNISFDVSEIDVIFEAQNRIKIAIFINKNNSFEIIWDYFKKELLKYTVI